MNTYDPNAIPGELTKHIPADLFEQMHRAEVVVPSAVVPAEYAARQNLNVVSVVTADGREIIVDVDAFAQRAVTTVAQRKPIPRWVVSTAVLMPITSGSFTLAAWGLSLTTPWLLAFAAFMQQVFYSALAIGFVAGMFALSRPKKGDGGPIVVTASAASRGFLNKANATATAIVRRR
ncbi:hypothetical protein ACFZAV_42710 [Streptomyces sp. NPDC008343]|uniref:hypothetical protein n=1 Tax=Streptomyces sp. NPDC008343 TaxID=3364828 RepID=UPI0036E2A2DB